LCLTKARLVVIGFEERARAASRHSSLCETEEPAGRAFWQKKRIGRPIVVPMQI
jgi:hypothetical protein